MNYRKTFIGLTEVDFEFLRKGDLFILREHTGILVGVFTADSDAFPADGVWCIKIKKENNND